MNNGLWSVYLSIAMLWCLICVVIFKRSNRQEPIVSNIETKFSYSFIPLDRHIYYIHDEWAQDSIRLKKEIFDTKLVIHSCDNVINTMSDAIPNRDFHIETLKYKKALYTNKLDSLLVQDSILMNSPDRYDTSIDYVKTYSLIH